MSPFYKSQVIHSIFLSLSYMHIYIYISPHSRINKHKFTHAIFLLSLSLSHIFYHYSMRSLSLYNRKGGINGFLFEYLSRWNLYESSRRFGSVVKQLAGKKIERIFVSPVLNLQKMTPSCRVSYSWQWLRSIGTRAASNQISRRLNFYIHLSKLRGESSFFSLFFSVNQLISFSILPIFFKQRYYYNGRTIDTMLRAPSQFQSRQINSIEKPWIKMCNSIRFFFVGTWCMNQFRNENIWTKEFFPANFSII